MSYQVLARKWRPKNFGELVGQEHVMQALMNALDQGRLHHAYLFTGTRGVGKTTIARILSKCLNCDTGVSSNPCGTCGSCQEINEGRFVDLIEVDAASRTKVEDTRELLENVQYAPSRGRYKVYLIDEVHMLSTHSFNALLKTLEEPPPHVKFLLATTDPQKLPVTVLSRCLQFHLKSMTPESVVGHLKDILEKEMIPFEEGALWALGRSANGSMRDALSLTDQAIAFGRERLTEADVNSMLGTIDRAHIQPLLEALLVQDGPALLSSIASMNEQTPDYGDVLAELISVLHRITIAQVVPDAIDNSFGDQEQISTWAQNMTAEDVQLFYQTALLGRKDLSLAPDARSGFEMVMLRMMLFKPQGVIAQGGAVKKPQAPASQPLANQAQQAPAPGHAPPLGNAAPPAGMTAEQRQQKESEIADVAAGRPRSSAVANQTTSNASAAAENSPPPISAAPQTANPAAAQAVPRQAMRAAKPFVDDKPTKGAGPAAAAPINVAPIAPPISHKDIDDAWVQCLLKLKMGGGLQNFANNCALKQQDGDRWLLTLHSSFEALYKQDHVDQLTVLLTESEQRSITVEVEISPQTRGTPAELYADQLVLRESLAMEAMEGDYHVRELITQFGAIIKKDSLKLVNS